MAVRRGDRVRVRSREEILATLDHEGAIDALPFMPEMLKFCGQELPVFSRAHKTCDTVENLGAVRELDHAIHLEGARCDGSAHGGCQAGCLLFWREEWLEGADAHKEPLGGSTAAETPGVETLHQQTRKGDLYQCQATAMKQASRPLPSHRLNQYVKDFGNFSVWTVLKSILITFFNVFQWQSRKRLPGRLLFRGGKTYPFYQGTGSGKRVPAGELQPGDLVKVRSKPEIMATLNADNKNGGMLFDGEMLPFCGQTARVERKVEQIIDEPTGKMLKLNDCLVLEDVVCPGTYHRACPRGGLPYWREAWLEKVQ